MLVKRSQPFYYIHLTSNTRGGYIRSWEATQVIKYKFKIIPPAESTFPAANSFLDVCIADTRLTLKNTRNNKLKTQHYDSDYRAIIVEISLNSDLDMSIDNINPKSHFIYKKCNWDKFRQKIKRCNVTPIPEDRNLTNLEIDEHLLYLENSIRSALETYSPKYKWRYYTDAYTNDKIRKLIRYKSYIVSQLHRTYKLGHTTSQTYFLKELLKINQEIHRVRNENKH